MTGAEMVAELQRRLTNLDSTVATAALNRAMSWVLRQSSYQFMMSGPLDLAVTATNDQLAVASEIFNIDPGKAKMLFNVDGSPVQRVPFSDLWSSNNYNVYNTNLYDAYAIRTDNYAGQTNAFYFTPNISGTVKIYYHRVSSGIGNDGNVSDLPPDFHPLLVDLAEADERRIYDIGDSWQILMGRSQDQLKLLIDGYRSETQQPTQLSDAQVKLQEQNTLGKA